MPSLMRSARTEAIERAMGTPVFWKTQTPFRASPTFPGVMAKGSPAMKSRALSRCEILLAPISLRKKCHFPQRST
jgi:hypothetical protein